MLGRDLEGMPHSSINDGMFMNYLKSNDLEVCSKIANRLCRSDILIREVESQFAYYLLKYIKITPFFVFNSSVYNRFRKIEHFGRLATMVSERRQCMQVFEEMR